MAHGQVEHDYHLVNPSPLPVITSFFTFLMAVGLVVQMKGLAGPDAEGISQFLFADGQWWVFGFGLTGILVALYVWWSNVITEGNQGDHTPIVQIGLRYGMIFFILSEVMFFAGWFWAFFEQALSFDARAAGVERGWDTEGAGLFGWAQWPPPLLGTETPTPLMNPWHIPLLNTLILLTSGTTVTWAHHAILENKRKEAAWGLAITVILGLIFTALQAYEYMEAYHMGLTMQSGLYGSAFYMATGFHGFHVIVGTLFLLVCLVRVLRGGLTPDKHIGFEAAAWYWHFVDVVWLFLFAFVYVIYG